MDVVEGSVDGDGVIEKNRLILYYAKSAVSSLSAINKLRRGS
jgi:hypothetical protein